MLNKLFKKTFSLESLTTDYNKIEDIFVRLDAFDFPGNWFENEDIIKLIETLQKQILHLSTDTKSFEKLDSYKIEKLIDTNLSKIELQLTKLINNSKKAITQIQNKKIQTRNPPITLLNNMKLLLMNLHKTILLLQGYPIFKIQTKKILHEILKLLENKEAQIAQIKHKELSSILKKFTNEELIIAIEYKSNENPLLLITKDNLNNLNRFILKTDISPKKLSPKSFLIAKLFNQFQIKGYNVKYKHIYSDNYEQYIHYDLISYTNGNPIANFHNFENLNQILAFSYFLGAASIQAYIFNLSDRYANVFLDFFELKNILKSSNQWDNFLGENNAIFHIDYEFSEQTNHNNYLYRELFNNWGGIYFPLFINIINQYKIDINQCRKIYIKGIEDEFNRLNTIFNKNKKQINKLIDTHSLIFITERLKKKHLDNIKLIETELFQSIKKNIKKVA